MQVDSFTTRNAMDINRRFANRAIMGLNDHDLTRIPIYAIENATQVVSLVCICTYVAIAQVSNYLLLSYVS